MSRIQLFHKVPKEVGVAVSGGVDSVAALHYLLEHKFSVTVVHYVHFSENADAEFEFVQSLAGKLDLPLIVGRGFEVDTSTSKEHQWREARYGFFKSLNIPIVLGHTLDDAVETYLFNSMHGLGKHLEPTHANTIRPFILTEKKDLEKFCRERLISWHEDETNADSNFCTRNHIRHKLLPEALKVNPGLYKVVKKRILEKANENDHSR